MPQTRQARVVERAIGRRLGTGERIETHHHDQAQLVYAAHGLLAVTTARGTWIAPPQRAVWVPAGADHRHRSYGATDMRALLFDPTMTAGQRVEPTVVAVSGLLREVVLVLTDQARRPDAARRRLERVALDELSQSPERPLHLPEPNDDRLRAVTNLLHAHPASHATLAELGHTVGASERTLSRLFGLEAGMSFQQWRTQLRVHYALVLLADGHSVTQTAIACGWANPSSFIEAFTHTVGQTPGRYATRLHAPERHARYLS